MANPVWKGEISFGLVNVSVSLYAAERRTGVHFNLLDSRDKAQVRYERINDETGEEVPWQELAKGYEYAKGDYVLLEQEDFEAAAPEASESIELERFVELAAIDCRYFDRPYYVVPGANGRKGYVLLRETLRDAGLAGIAKVVIRSREHLAAVLVIGEALVLNLLRFAQELRDPEGFELPSGPPSDYKVSRKERRMAEQLLESMTDDWRPEDYHDEYREALMEYIEDKAKKGQKKQREQEKRQQSEQQGESDKVVNLSERLEQSVRRQDSGGGKKSSDNKSGSKGKSSSKGSGGKKHKGAGKRKKSS